MRLFEPVEHGFNGAGEVVAFVSPLPAEPVSWRPDGDALIWVDIPGHLEKCFGLSPEVRKMAEETRRLLLVEVGSETIERQAWLPLQDA